MTPVTYYSEQPKDYAEALDDSDSLPALCAFLAEWKELAADAERVALTMSEEDFKEFRRGLKKERRGSFAGEKWNEKYGAILMPEVMFKISIRACDYKVPFGLMYLRLKETGITP